MIRLAVTGLWLSVVALGGAYGGAEWAARKSTPAEVSAKKDSKLEIVKLRMISVPIIANGEIDGYVVARLGYAAHAADLKTAPLKPDDFVIDEVFRLIYADWAPGANAQSKQDLEKLSKVVSANVNRRLGQPIVRDVLIQDLNYVHKKDIRNGAAP